MANQITLMQYLQRGPPAIPTNPPSSPGPNTTNHAYGWEDISSVNHWNTFNLQTVVQRYGQLLTTTAIQNEPMPTSPPQAVNSENLIRYRVSTYLKDRVRRALRSGFTHGGNVLNGLTPLSFNGGEAACVIQQYRPDTAYFDPAIPVGTGWNRAPGDMKPSWKWSTNLRTSQDVRDRQEYHQVLSQVN